MKRRDLLVIVVLTAASLTVLCLAIWWNSPGAQLERFDATQRAKVHQEYLAEHEEHIQNLMRSENWSRDEAENYLNSR